MNALLFFHQLLHIYSYKNIKVNEITFLSTSSPDLECESDLNIYMYTYTGVSKGSLIEIQVKFCCKDSLKYQLRYHGGYA